MKAGPFFFAGRTPYKTPSRLKLYPLAALVCLVCLSSIYAHAATVYVATNGDDHSLGTSPSAPWRTLARANKWLAHAHAGDRLLLRGGDVFRDDYLRCTHLDAAEDIAAQHAEGACGGSASAPVLIGSYGQGRAVIDAADPLSLPWRSVGAGVYSATLDHTPSKVFADASKLDDAQLLPVPNAVGVYSEGANYRFLDLVTHGDALYVHGALPATTGVPPSTDTTWVQVASGPSTSGPQGFSATNSGPENVRSIPGSWYTDGKTIWVHLRDGSDPHQHAIAATYRAYGAQLLSTRNVTVKNVAFAHQGESAIFAVAYADVSVIDGVAPNENIRLQNNTCAHFGGLVTSRFPLAHEANYLQGCIVIAASGDCTPHLLRGIAVDGNDIGAFDGYFGTGEFLAAGIFLSGIDGGGSQNIDVITHNKVHTHAARGIVYANTSLSTCGGDGVLNHGGTVGWNELTDNQGNLFFTQTAGGKVTGNFIHHSFGEGVQSGGGSHSDQAEPQVFEHNVIAFLGRSANGGLYNGFDCNGSPRGVDGAFWRNNTVFDTDSAAITLENGCTNAHVENNIFDMGALRFPAHDRVNNSYLMYFVDSSHTSGTVFSHNLWINGSNPQPFHSKEASYSCEEFLAKWPDRNSACAKDAGFVAPDRNDFRLTAHSVAKGKGSDGANQGAKP